MPDSPAPEVEDESESADCEGEESSSDESSSEELPQLNVLERRRRATAGRAGSAKDGKELEDDEAFWGHDEWADRSNDSEVAFSSSDMHSADSSDSDFDAPSEVKDNSGDEAAKAEDAVRETKVRRCLLPKRVAKRPTPRKKTAAPPAKTDAKPRKTREVNGADASPEVKARTVRNSTRRQTVQATERAVTREAKPAQRARASRAPRLTQMQRLEEAARTEERSRAELQAMQELAAADPRQVQSRGKNRKRCQGPRIRWVSRRLINGEVETFLECHGLEPASLLHKATPAAGPPAQPRCAITGLPARYRDPQTGIPFATASAFAKIRADHSLPRGSAVRCVPSDN